MALSSFCRVKIGFGLPPLADQINVFGTDVTADVREVHANTARRSSRFADTFIAGKLTLRLDNRDGTYDPNNTSGTHYGDFRRNIQISVEGLESGGSSPYVWRGYVRSFEVTYPTFGDSVTVVEAIDPMGLLAEYELAPIDPPAYPEQVEARINRVLDLVDYPTGGNRDIDPTGTVLNWTAFGRTALAEIVNAARADGGLFYSSGSQVVVFESRHSQAYRSNQRTSQATFRDDASPKILDGSVVMAAFGENYRNRVEVTVAETGETATTSNIATDDTIIAHALTVDVPTIGQAESVAEYLCDLHSAQVSHVERFTVTAATNQGLVDGDTVFDIRLRDRITVQINPPGAGSTVDHDLMIDGISHRITPDRWDITYHCSSADVYDTELSAAPADWLIIGTDLVGTGKVGY